MRNYSIEDLVKMSYKKRKEVYKEHYDFLLSINYKNAKHKSSKRSKILESYITLIHYCKNKGGCSDCGEDNFRLLEFDHIDMTDKKESISRLVQYSKKTMLKELKKCNILCVSCHRLKTQNDLNHYKLFNKDFQSKYLD